MCHRLRRAGSTSTAVEFSEGRVRRSIEPPLRNSGQPCRDDLEAGNERMIMRIRHGREDNDEEAREDDEGE